MARQLELLLVENVDNLGIVGDVVKVRSGYARNFLLPRSLATVPSDELIKSLQAKRIEAEKLLSENRKARESTIGRLAGFELTMIKSCNDQGILYAAVTQPEIAEALTAAGYAVRPRDVRISGAIKRVDNYHVVIKFDANLETSITLHIKADREIKQEERAEMEFDNEGNLIQPGSARARKMQEADEKAAAKRAERRAKLMGTEDGPRQVVVGWGKRPDASEAASDAPKDKGGKEKGEKKEKSKK